MTNKKEKILYITTDGAIYNGGNRNGSGVAIGGIGIVFSLHPNNKKTIFKRLFNTFTGPTYGKEEEIITNNRMELMAAINSLEYLYENYEDLQDWKIVIRSDSQYVIKSKNEYLPNWLNNFWKNSSKKPVRNMDLWKRLIKAEAKFNKGSVTWKHEKGHAGHPIQEESDALATKAVKMMKKIIYR